jgi:hypothetical protein
MKHLCLVFAIIFCLIGNLKSQGGGVGSIIVALSQRSTVLYSDTIFEIDGLKFKITETYAFRNKIKTTIILLNKSENFKIIHSEDFTITDSDNNAITVNTKKPMVIAPGATKKIGLMAESKSFKLYDIKISLKQIYTTGATLFTAKPGLFNARLEGIESCVAGPLEILRTKCTNSTGFVRTYFKVNYSGANFLVIRGQNAMLLTASRKNYMNVAPKSKITYFPEDKVSVNLMLEFDNPAPNFDGQNCDKISLDNVFVEYELLSNNKLYEFHTYKNGMNEGDSPFEKKEREDIED